MARVFSTNQSVAKPLITFVTQLIKTGFVTLVRIHVLGHRCVGETDIHRNMLAIQWKHVRQCSYHRKQQWRNSRQTETVSVQRTSPVISR